MCLFLFLRGHQSQWTKNPPLWPHLTLITWGRLYLQTQSHWRSGRQHMKFKSQNSVHNIWACNIKQKKEREKDSLILFSDSCLEKNSWDLFVRREPPPKATSALKPSPRKAIWPLLFQASPQAGPPAFLTAEHWLQLCCIRLSLSPEEAHFCFLCLSFRICLSSLFPSIPPIPTTVPLSSLGANKLQKVWKYKENSMFIWTFGLTTGPNV